LTIICARSRAHPSRGNPVRCVQRDARRNADAPLLNGIVSAIECGRKISIFARHLVGAIDRSLFRAIR
jgi:hypothetical protein